MDREYPTQAELRKIKNWKFKKREDYAELMEYVQRLWHWPEYARLTGRRIKTLRLVTGGWSGNESIVAALDSNLLFSMLCWQMSKRGGLHIYKLPKIRNDRTHHPKATP